MLPNLPSYIRAINRMFHTICLETSPETLGDPAKLDSYDIHLMNLEVSVDSSNNIIITNCGIKRGTIEKKVKFLSLISR